MNSNTCMPCVELRVSTFSVLFSWLHHKATTSDLSGELVWVCVQHQNGHVKYYISPAFGNNKKQKQRPVNKWCLFVHLLTISGVLWCLLSVRLYKAIVSVHMFVCEIPDKALIITEEQGHIGELLICWCFFFFI